MEIVNRFSRLCSAYTTSACCPSFSKVVKSVTVVAGAILGWRYAPKLTVTVCAGVAFYYGAKYFGASPSSSVRRPKIEETSPPNAESLATSPEEPRAQKSAASIEKPITSLADVWAWIEENHKSPNPQEIVALLISLYKFKPPTLDMLTWQLALPSPEDCVSHQENFLNAHPDIARAWLQALKEACEPSDIEHKLDECNSELIKKVNPGLDFIKAAFYLSAVLGHHSSLINRLMSEFKKQSDPALREDLKDRDLRIFILQIIWLSCHKEGVEFVFTRINKEKFQGTQHPLTPGRLGPSSYTHFLACEQWYRATGQAKYVSLIKQLKGKIETHPSELTMSNMPELSLKQFMVLEMTKFLEPFEQHVKKLEALIAALKSSSSDRELKDLLFETFSALYKLKPPETSVIAWDVPGAGSQQFMVALTKKTTIEASNFSSLINSLNDPNSLIAQVNEHFIFQQIIECDCIPVIFALSALLGMNPALCKILVSNLETPTPDENFRRFLLDILWLSQDKESVSFCRSSASRSSRSYPPS
jgi:hypothetical protein